MSESIEDFARLDIDRRDRRGYPEAIYCEPKTVEQLTLIARHLKQHPGPHLFTRISSEQAEAVLTEVPEASYDPQARLLVFPPELPAPCGETVLVVCAGTSDLPVAKEALLTARYLGRHAELIADVGIAGLHRIQAVTPQLREAGVVIVVAGMDGALPGVVAGLVSSPVVAVPTSVGYGVGADGIAALLTMLNACAPGVGVVNIDNGYGAGHLAAQIAAPRA